MSLHQSRRRQRQLECDLFGPGPAAHREARRQMPVRMVDQVGAPGYTPGNCPMCGDCCELAPGDPWECDSCGMVYPPGRWISVGGGRLAPMPDGWEQPYKGWKGGTDWMLTRG